MQQPRKPQKNRPKIYAIRFSLYLLSLLNLFFYSNFSYASSEEIQAQITYQERKIRAAQQWLDTHPDVYRYGRCTQPSVNSSSRSQCSYSERHNKAVALCAAAVGGCGVVANAIGSELDSTTARFLSSQACSAWVNEIQGQDYTLEDMLGNFALDVADDYASSLLQEEGFFANLVGVAIKGTLLAKKVADFSECVEYAETQCDRIYVDHNNIQREREARLLKAQCDNYRQQITSAQTAISRLRQELNASPPAYTIASNQAPVNLVRAYYQDLDHNRASAAIDKRKPSLSARTKDNLRSIIEGVEWFKVNRLSLERSNSSTAIVATDVSGKQRGRQPERWTGTIELKRYYGDWRIEHLNLTNAPDIPQYTTERQAPIELVRSYVTHLNSRNATAAINQWKPLSYTRQERLRELINGIEWFELNSIHLISSYDDSAFVSVTVRGKQRGRSSEKWNGNIELVKRRGEWKIAVMDMDKL